jgi:hypothetical protein
MRVTGAKRKELKMLTRQIVYASLLAGIVATPSVWAHHEGGPSELVGVWLCHSTRPGSPNRPVMFAYHRDGLLTISSGTNIVVNRNANDRGGLVGEWTHHADGYHSRVVELLYKDGVPTGRIFVDSTPTLNADGSMTNHAQVVFTTLVYDANGFITKETFEPPVASVSDCRTLDDAFMVAFAP